ncbi:MAG: AAA family ATPase, partial [Chloroflexi bacterium]|nr:AAA family ATPase [Chloroflexota bacterium]
VLNEFRKVEEEIAEWLDQRKNRVGIEVGEGKTRAGIKFGEVSPVRRQEAKVAITAWYELKRMGAHLTENRSHIATVLRYLGFNLESYTPTNIDVVQLIGNSLLYAKVSMSYGGNLPVPQFGSQARDMYHVICLWERPGMETIDARLKELQLQNRNVIVLYLGRLTMRQRGDLVRVTREQKMVLAILDEILLVFLAGERDTRLPAFLRCALPFVTINPYTPFQAGDVPPEMFFGRKNMLIELQRPEGSCMVYGGRQLGKSALLRQVQRDFHHPKTGQYAWVEDIKLIGDPTSGQPADVIWQRLRDALRSLELINTRTEKIETIIDYVRDKFKSGESQMLFMLDEADKFLDADAKENFRNVERLRQLMLDTNRQFKVIFTGLHNVQ